jgi:hypothetical protein
MRFVAQASLVALAFMLATIDTAFASPLRVIRSDASQIDLEAR